MLICYNKLYITGNYKKTNIDYNCDLWNILWIDQQQLVYNTCIWYLIQPGFCLISIDENKQGGFPL
jgi:hypothetical protein